MHTGRPVVLRFDLRDFFASVSAARVYGIFLTLGYDRSLAHTLTGLCSNTIPTTVWNATEPPEQPHLIQPHFWLGRALATPHLPQGAPTSPALANLAAFALDRRLSGLGSAAQRQLVAGVVVNTHANIPRPEYDRLKAILHRFAVDGPGTYDPGRSVDLHAHLRGQVAWVNAVNPRRGKKLHRLLTTINWDANRRTDP